MNLPITVVQVVIMMTDMDSEIRNDNKPDNLSGLLSFAT